MTLERARRAATRWLVRNQQQVQWNTTQHSASEKSRPFFLLIRAILSLIHAPFYLIVIDICLVSLLYHNESVNLCWIFLHHLPNWVLVLCGKQWSVLYSLFFCWWLTWVFHRIRQLIVLSMISFSCLIISIHFSYRTIIEYWGISFLTWNQTSSKSSMKEERKEEVMSWKWNHMKVHDFICYFQLIDNVCSFWFHLSFLYTRH